MPKKRASPSIAGGGPVMVILEEIRSQNRATIEAVEAHRDEVRRDTREFREAVRADMQMLQAAVHGNSDVIRQLSSERLEALERRSA